MSESENNNLTIEGTMPAAASAIQEIKVHIPSSGPQAPDDDLFRQHVLGGNLILESAHELAKVKRAEGVGVETVIKIIVRERTGAHILVSSYIIR